MRLYTLIYTSQASEKVTNRTLMEIARSSVRRNERIGVTGLLLYGSGNYFQVLEGGVTAVKALCRRILFDNRHHEMKILFEAPIADRLFPAWQMGRLNLDDPDPDPEAAECWTELSQLVEPSRSNDQTSRDHAVALVREFIKHHARDAMESPHVTPI